MLYETSPENSLGWVDEVQDLSEADRRLGVLEATSKIAGTELEIILRGLERVIVQNTQEENSEESDEIHALLERVQKLKWILAETRQEGMQIDRVLRQSIHEVREGIKDVNARETLNSDDLTSWEREQVQNSVIIEQAKKDEFIRTIDNNYNTLLRQTHPSPELTLLIERYSIAKDNSPTLNMNVTEKLDFISRQNIELASLQFEFEKILRDSSVVGENGETLWVLRKSIVEEKFEEIKQTGTEIQKQIIGESTFQNIRPDQLSALSRSWIDLASFMLIDEAWKTFSWSFEANQEYIFNASWNNNLWGYLLAYIFDVNEVESIQVWNIVYTRDTSVPSQGFVNSEGISPSSLRDGEIVKIVSVKKLDETQSEAVQSAVQESYYDDRSAYLTDDFIENAEANGFNIHSFFEAIASGNLLAFLTQIEHLVNGRFQQDTETGSYTQYDQATWEYIPISAADMSIASLENFPESYRANLIRSCRRAWISVDDFVNQMNQECQLNWFPPQRFIALIWHESGWRSNAQNPTSSAYGLWQMIDSTWASYAWGGNRDNPIDQMKASLRYLKHIMQVRWCSPEDACAFYNTGEWFEISNSPAPSSYVRQNGVIVDKIPWNLHSDGITSREYFLWAVAYYNDINFEEARSRSRFG